MLDKIKSIFRLPTRQLGSEKIKISRILSYRRKVRIFTIFSALLVMVALGSMMIGKGPRSTKAVNATSIITIRENGYIFDTFGDGATVSDYCPSSAATVTSDGNVVCDSSKYAAMPVNGANVTIDGSNSGGITIIEYGTFSPANLTINNATLTHDALIAGKDFIQDSTTGNLPVLTSAGKYKKVDLNISGDLTLSNGGKIDVSGKGYPGGPAGCPGNNGYGPGGGGYTHVYSFSSGNGTAHGAGGGHGGIGAIGSGSTGQSTSVFGPAGVVNDDSKSPSDYGSGGGSASVEHTSDLCVGGASESTPGNGGSGGGLIQINASSISGNGSVIADGVSGVAISDPHGGDGSSGSGAGGTINITVNGTVALNINSTRDITSSGGSGAGSATPIIDHADIITKSPSGLTIHADGGSNAAGGGGGLVYVSQPKVVTQCTIKAYQTGADGAGYIPAACEDQAVTIDGSAYSDPNHPFTIYADEVGIWKAAKKRPTYQEYTCPAVFNSQNFSYKDPSDHCRYGSSPGLDGGLATPVSSDIGDVCYAPNLVYIDYSFTGTADIGLAVNDTACDTHRHFSSLKVTNGAVLTHQAVAATDFSSAGLQPSTSLANLLVGSGRLKKVDIAVDGDITLSTGGNINVNNKGYPGGTTDQALGYGPGGGGSASDSIYGLTTGGGGSYSTIGSKPFFTSYAGVATQGYQNVYPAHFNTFSFTSGQFDFGSGGGFANDGGQGRQSNGGHGGGRIYMTSQTQIILDAKSFISANGEDYNSATDSRSGSGSGGTVWLEAPLVSTAAGAKISHVTANDGSNQAGMVDDDFDSYNIFANGGTSCESQLCFGGGGRIVIKKPATQSNGVSVRKTLIAQDRSGSGTGFNPYALQVGDQIEVELFVSDVNTGQTVTITDNFLKTSDGAHICGSPTASSPTASATTISSISWSVSSDTILKYKCTVSK